MADEQESQEPAADDGRNRVGIAKGLFEVPDDIDGDTAWILDLFYGEP